MSQDEDVNELKEVKTKDGIRTFVDRIGNQWVRVAIGDGKYEYVEKHLYVEFGPMFFNGDTHERL